MQPPHPASHRSPFGTETPTTLLLLMLGRSRELPSSNTRLPVICCGSVTVVLRAHPASLMATVDCEQRMRAWFCTTTHTTQKPLCETDIDEIAQVLSECSQPAWSLIPRIYSVLKIIDCIDAIEYFVSEKITDFWFPFSQKTLPVSFQDTTARNAFLQNQELVFNIRTIRLEHEESSHGHFRDASAIPFKKIGELGKGGFGSVDRVLSTITHREYARKQLPRGRTFRKDKEVLRAFEQELSRLKSLSKNQHQHVVKLIGSYTDPRYVGIITSPVADRNLHEHLTQDLGPGPKSFLRPFFGCLASALCYLHDNNVRHKDIKPQNILVKGEHVYLTDFGLAIDRNDLSRSTTVGLTTSTPRYAAPEVADSSARSWSADVWSLGCVFLEMWTVLNGESVQALHSHMTDTGTFLHCYCSNSSSVQVWLELISSNSDVAGDKTPAVWIEGMLKIDRSARLSARAVLDSILTYSEDPTSTFSFIGHCCLHEDDTDESVVSSAIAAAADVTARASTQSISQGNCTDFDPSPFKTSEKEGHMRDASSVAQSPILSHSSPLSKPSTKEPHKENKEASLGAISVGNETSDSDGRDTSSFPSGDQRTILQGDRAAMAAQPLHSYVEDEAVSLERETNNLINTEFRMRSTETVSPCDATEAKSAQQWVFYTSKESSDHQIDSGAEADNKAKTGAYASDQTLHDTSTFHTQGPDADRRNWRASNISQNPPIRKNDEDTSSNAESSYTDASIAGSVHRAQSVPMEPSAGVSMSNRQEQLRSPPKTTSRNGKSQGNLTQMKSLYTDCPTDEELHRPPQKALEKGWQRCYNCKAVVELKAGCNHATCRCKAQFCMVCAVPWKTCNCPWFDHSQTPDEERHDREERRVTTTSMNKGPSGSPHPISLQQINPFRRNPVTAAHPGSPDSVHAKPTMGSNRPAPNPATPRCASVLDYDRIPHRSSDYPRPRANSPDSIHSDRSSNPYMKLRMGANRQSEYGMSRKDRVPTATYIRFPVRSESPDSAEGNQSLHEYYDWTPRGPTSANRPTVVRPSSSYHSTVPQWLPIVPVAPTFAPAQPDSPGSAHSSQSAPYYHDWTPRESMGAKRPTGVRPNPNRHPPAPSVPTPPAPQSYLYSDDSDQYFTHRPAYKTKPPIGVPRPATNQPPPLQTGPRPQDKTSDTCTMAGISISRGKLAPVLHGGSRVILWRSYVEPDPQAVMTQRANVEVDDWGCGDEEEDDEDVGSMVARAPASRVGR
ncbi:hypothetical protein OPT61_g6924 [Boeremia exigua]|uniref:Uncharacterized protein n=1 Tax=Boeremia exigua TaxID=749465 RepID=A0ACC2I4A2_9PLEO|nr:hypothetical protein OPT61_g6924 [Boeremia exigua]